MCGIVLYIDAPEGKKESAGVCVHWEALHIDDCFN